jgi:hypothetical protein
VGSHTVTAISSANSSASASATIYISNYSGSFTYHNDNQRTGQNVNETALTPSNVNSTQFGKLFSLPVDGQLFAQPLYVPSLTIGSQVHNVLFLATQHASVYAWDADTASTTPPSGGPASSIPLQASPQFRAPKLPAVVAQQSTRSLALPAPR